MDEKELSQKIADFLNKYFIDYEFEFIDDFCDVADELHKVYIEVKTNHFAPAQILHAIAKKNISDAKYVGVADIRNVKLYNPPSFENIISFATSFDPELVFTPSQVDKPSLNAKANKLLGIPVQNIKLEFPDEKFFYIDKENIKSIKPVLDKYNIEPHLLIAWLSGVEEKDVLMVTREGWLVNVEKTNRFMNVGSDERKNPQYSGFDGSQKPKHNYIRKSDAILFESLRIHHEDLASILHEIDRLQSRTKRRERGVFWTQEETGNLLSSEVLELTNPDYVVEPCVGDGSLISGMMGKVKGAMNDIDPLHVESCKTMFDGYD